MHSRQSDKEGNQRLVNADNTLVEVTDFVGVVAFLDFLVAVVLDTREKSGNAEGEDIVPIGLRVVVVGIAPACTTVDVHLTECENFGTVLCVFVHFLFPGLNQTLHDAIGELRTVRYPSCDIKTKPVDRAHLNRCLCQNEFNHLGEDLRVALVNKLFLNSVDACLNFVVVGKTALGLPIRVVITVEIFLVGFKSIPKHTCVSFS